MVLKQVQEEVTGHKGPVWTHVISLRTRHRALAQRIHHPLHHIRGAFFQIRAGLVLLFIDVRFPEDAPDWFPGNVPDWLMEDVDGARTPEDGAAERGSPKGDRGIPAFYAEWNKDYTGGTPARYPAPHPAHGGKAPQGNTAHTYTLPPPPVPATGPLPHSPAQRKRPYLQYRIGKMYAAGLGTGQDYGAAARWLALHILHEPVRDVPRKPVRSILRELISDAFPIRQLRPVGKKVYGYLKRDVKNLVDRIVDELAKDERIDALYRAWGKWQDEILSPRRLFSDPRGPGSAFHRCARSPAGRYRAPVPSAWSQWIFPSGIRHCPLRNRPSGGPAPAAAVRPAPIQEPEKHGDRRGAEAGQWKFYF